MQRTTLTLDEDVAAKVKQEMQRTGSTFKETINHLLRRGLLATEKPKSKRFEVRPRSLEARPGIDFDNIGQLLEQLDGPRHP